MIAITLTRDLWTPNETLGWLVVGSKKWPSIERPWVPSPITPAGEKGRSCVGLGEYRVESHSTEAHPKSWALINQKLDVYHWPWEVPQSKAAFARTVCLIHPANWASELRGCIAIGKRRLQDSTTGRWMVESSRDAINELRSALGVTAIDVRITIVDGRGS